MKLNQKINRKTWLSISGEFCEKQLFGKFLVNVKNIFEFVM